jgi:hypothetical protein
MLRLVCSVRFSSKKTVRVGRAPVIVKLLSTSQPTMTTPFLECLRIPIKKSNYLKQNKNDLFTDVTPRSPTELYLRFGETFCPITCLLDVFNMFLRNIAKLIPD